MNSGRHNYNNSRSFDLEILYRFFYRKYPTCIEKIKRQEKQSNSFPTLEVRSPGDKVWLRVH